MNSSETSRSDPERLRLVESYRNHLKDVWDIAAVADTETLESMLRMEDVTEFRRWRTDLLESDRRETHEAFYRWTADARRWGIVHSAKWMEILSGGVLAVTVLRAINAEKELIDLGCNAGYWTSWASGLLATEVVGIERALPRTTPEG